MLLKFKKEQLEAALESRRPWAQRLDKKRKAQHAREEAKYMLKFKEALEKALAWDYEKAKKEAFRTGLPSYDRDRPQCPQGVEYALDKHIAYVAMDGREKYVLSPASPRRYNDLDTTEIYWLLTHDENAKPDVCS